MGEVEISFEDIVKRTKLHKEKQLQWSLKQEEYSKQLNILKGKKAAYSLCLETLQKQIEDVKNKILVAKGMTPLPPQTPPKVENQQQQITPSPSQRQASPLSPVPSVVAAAIAKKSAQSTPQASPLKTPDSKPKETKEKPKKRKKAASSKPATPASLKYTINIHLDSIRAVCFYNSLPIVVSASDDGTIRLTNCEPVSATGKKVRNPVNFASLRGHSTPVVCLTPYELNDHQYMFSGSIDGSIGLWDLPRKQANIYDVTGHVDHHKINEFDFHKDAVWSIATDGVNAVSVSADGTAKYWQISESPSTVDLPISALPVSTKVISQNEFIVATEDGKLHFFKGDQKQKEIDIQAPIHTLSEVVDNKICATCGDQRIFIIAIDGSEPPRNFAATKAGKRIESCAITTDGECIITTATDREVRVWSTENDQILFSEVMHKDKYGECCLCSAVTSKNQEHSYFATGGAEGTLQIYTHNA